MTRQRKFLNAALAAVALAFILPAKSFAQLPSWEVPVFQYAVFYNLNLEVDPGAVFPITGPVFCNAGIWSGTANVTYSSTVEAVGQISTNEYDPFVLNNSKVDAGTPQSSFQYPGQPVSGVVPITMQNGEPAIANAESLINLPPANVRAPQETAYELTNMAYTFNAASLIVSNWYWGSNGVAPWSNNFTVYLQDSVLAPSAVQSNGIAMHWIELTNDFYIISNRTASYQGLWPNSENPTPTNYVPNFQFTNNMSSIRWTNTVAGGGPLGTNSVWYAGFSFLTNATFYDQRESATVRAVQLDVGRLGAWIAASSANGGSNWSQELCEDSAHGINSVFVYNAVPFIGQQQLPAVRLVKGWQLPNCTNIINDNNVVTSGLTLVTPQPMYVLGSYNVEVAGSQPLLGSHNTANTYPAAIMADAITILSSNWDDANSSDTIGSRASANTTINAACLSGIVPSSEENYSGGLENYFRLLENWGSGGVILTYNGSMVAMFPSIYATNFWPGTGIVYDAPDRNWAYDTNFLMLSDLPPLTWTLGNSNSVPMITAQPTNEAVLVGQTTNFTITATGVPAVGYQWNFKGTNIPGATNDSLVLTDLQLTNAGNYSVDVTNVLGSVISSNALLSVYTSAAPVLDAFSFSPDAGAGFMVSGVPGFNYEVLASSNLMDWVPLVTSNSPFIFVDTNIALPQRFYRSIYVP
jgi:hypothetical protein